ncbi:MLP-like protein 34 [Arachis duranensis]|uniref:MLP-like protein 34 n=1 Tax=Arachis duranensis TaxID=130453 RepID=A0A6P4C4T0_ARADU|nr:MLP-like protein 34 [Arachis duranensis]XP_015939258.1 MLP-like protein 34 [Arachis duranensis]
MTTSQVQKIETEFPIKADAKEFYDVFCNKTHQVAKACPDIIQSVVIHEGRWGTERSIISWNYVHDGKACVSKEIIEDIDKENNKMSFRVLEGDLVKHHYKSFKFLLHAVPKEKGGSMVRWTMEYEKINENTSDPHTLMQLVVDMSKQIEAHLLKK